jgi:hypothetical protein
VEIPPPLRITWRMKDVSTADSSLQELSDGRLEMRVEHEVVKGVTAEMLVWWFRNFPPARLEHQGRLVHMFRIWHPSDHIRFRVLRRPRDRSPGMSRGARIMYSQVVGNAPVRVRARVAQMDEGGLHLVLRRWFTKVGDLRHTFTQTPEGVVCRSRLVVGSNIPGLGRLVNRLWRRRLFPSERGAAWIRHSVEQIGNFEFFLPKLYRERPPDHD